MVIPHLLLGPKKMGYRTWGASVHVKEKLQKLICSAFCLCVFDNKTLLEIVSYDWCPCDSYINTFYFLNLIYQYTVMSDTTLFTKNIMFCKFVFCMVICFQLIACGAYGWQQSTSSFTHQRWKKNHKITNLTIFPLWLQKKGLYTLMKVCFCGEIQHIWSHI